MRPLCRYILLFTLTSIGLCSRPPVSAQDPVTSIEVLAKGPVHEAFASGSEQLPQAGIILTKAPPEAIDELPPDQKPSGDNVVWIPGYWAFDEERKDFIWISGFWRNAPPGRTWVPGGWRKVSNGFQWVSGFWSPLQVQQQQANVQYFQTPPAPIDIGPSIPPPVDSSIYVPGSWVWKSHWAWRPGYWIDFRPGYIWVPAHYRWTPSGYVYIDGYWDYTLADRGMLFAPVYFRAPLYNRPSYYYTPSVWIRDDCLVRAMFLRRGWGVYYFGDYFGEAYSTKGYTAWVSSGNVSVGFAYARNYYDPMFAYYRAANRTDPFWNKGIVDLYAARNTNPALRPPATLAQQNAAMKALGNSHADPATLTQQIQNASMLAGIRDTKQTAVFKLQTINDAARQEHAKVARNMQDLGRSRTVLESRLVTNPPHSPDGSHRIQLDVPKSLAMKANTVQLPQPTQVHPKADPAAEQRRPIEIPQLPSGSAYRPNGEPPSSTSPNHPNPGSTPPPMPKSGGSTNPPPKDKDKNNNNNGGGKP